MNTQHLRYAIEVGKTGSITQAAENLYIGQPSLSKALKELEESLGITIFKRTSKGALPTAQGERFLVYAREVLRQVEQMEQLARADHLTAQRFHISIPRVAYVNEAVLSLLSGMKQESDMDVKILRCSAIRAIQHVADQASEMAVIRYPVRYERYFLDYIAEKKLQTDTVWEGPLPMLMQADHPLALADEIRTDDLKQYPIITFEDEDVPYLALEDAGEVESGRRIEVSDEGMMHRVLQAVPEAFALCGEPGEGEALQEELIVRGADCLGRVRDALIYPQEYVFRPQDKQFIDELFVARNKKLYGDNKTLEMELQT